MSDEYREVREARRAINGAKGRKARKLANRDLQRQLRGKGLAERKLADAHEEMAAARRKRTRG